MLWVRHIHTNKQRPTMSTMTSPILANVGSLRVDAAESFVLRRFFKSEKYVDGMTSVSIIGDETKNRFIDENEENIVARVLNVQRTIEDVFNPDIILALNDDYEVSVTHYVQALMILPESDIKSFVVDGFEVIAYVRDYAHELWALRAGLEKLILKRQAWNWNVYAYNIECTVPWRQGRYILS